MKLETYLAKHNLSPEAFGKKMDASGTIVRLWLKGAVPSGNSCWEIEKATGGLVQLKDWFEDNGGDNAP